MLKWIKAGVIALALASWSMPVSASDDGGVSHIVVTNTTDQLFNAVDEASTSLLAAPFTQLTIFISGTYENINTVVLQKEVGSPGSGAFETVQTITQGNANERLIEGYLTGPNTDNYRLLMTATGTGAVVAYMTDYPQVARTWVRDGNFTVLYDEFLESDDDNASPTVINDELYLAFANTASGANELIAVIDESNLEGAILQESSDGAADEMVCFGAILLATQGATVGGGWISFESRVAFSSYAGKGGISINDTLCVSNAVSLSDITGTTVAANGATDSVAEVRFDDGATSALFFHAVSAIANAEGANALVVVGPATGTANDYVTLRVEIDNLGNAFFFHNGTMFHAEPLAVTVAAEVMFRVESGTSATTTGVNSTIDYIQWVTPRPTAPTT